MQQDIINNKVKAEFYIFADKLDFPIVDELMGIKATKRRSKDSFPIKEFAADYWILSIDYEISEDINIQLDKLLCFLPGKNIIKKICEKYNARSGFLIVVESGEEYLLPSIYYKKSFVEFAAYIGAEINMDFV